MGKCVLLLIVAATALRAPPTSRVPAAALSATATKRVPASGYAKRLARERGVDVSALSGSGPGGRIVARDVEAALTTAVTAVGGSGDGASPAVRAALEALNAALGVEAAAGAARPRPSGPVALTGMQKAIAKNMEATLDVPVFRVTKKVRTDALDALYAKLKGEGVSVSSLLTKACALALAANPLLNAAYDPAGNILYKAEINVAQAVALDGGLITPTLKNADARPLADLAAGWKDLVVKARAGTLAPDEYQSGTFTISNLGMMAVSKFGAILPKGTGAILAVASSAPRLVSMPEALLGLATHKMMTVTLTCDHRIISGADAARFLSDFQKHVENPATLLE